MSNRTKGLVVALATVVVVGIQISSLAAATGYIAYLVILAIPCGLYAGSLAGELREDRFLRIAAFGLAIPAFLGFLTLLAQHRPLTQLATKLVGTSAIPLVIAAAALERWTRPADLLPVARPPRRGWRKPTVIELAVVSTTLACAVVAVMIALDDHPPRSVRYGSSASAFDVEQVHAVFVFLAGAALPVGVLLGRLAQAVVRGRLVVLGCVAILGAMWVGCLLEVFTPVSFAGRYLLPVVGMVIALDRLTAPHRERAPLGPGALGMLIGLANGVAISLALLVLVLREASFWGMDVLLIPCVILAFAIPAGAIYGGLAGRLQANRGVVLQLLALGGVFLLAMAFDIPIGTEPSALGFFVWSCCTTAIGVFILERATRKRHGSDPHGTGAGEALRDATSAGGGIVRG